MRIATPIEEYIMEHISPEGDYLYRLYRATNIETVNPQMASGHIQGRFLKMIVQMIKPKNILEIGTFTGYSAISLAEGLEEDGILYTFDIDDELEDFTRKWIKNSPVGKKIHYEIGNALTEIPKLGIMFDLIFIDGDKREYIKYYETVMRYLNTGGWILVDNTLWDGHVIDKERHDIQTESIRNFNNLIKEDSRIEKVILPLRDGLTIIRKTNDYKKLNK